jgi:tetratricopeptide (TPR) repeat protein
MTEDEPETAGTLEAGPPPGMPSFPSDLPPGALIGRYMVLQALGSGATGTVYAAYDSELDRRVALKFLRDRVEGTEADEWRGRMQREAKAMARLSHPNVVTLYDVGLSSEGRIFLAMEMVEGGTLGDWLEAEKRTWREIVALFCEAGEGLEAAHRAGMIHRDFKLDNVVVGKDGRPRVTDFGLARGSQDPAADPGTIPPRDAAPGDSPPSLVASGSAGPLDRLTTTGAVMGTPGYMAPEQYTSDVEIDVRADTFAFCATLYRALYGQRAFAGKTVEEIAESTLLGRVSAPPKGSDVPLWVHKVVLSGLASDRRARPESMREVLAALRADPSRRRRRWLVAGGMVAAVGAIALSAFFLVHAAGERRVRGCLQMADRLGGAWDDPRKDAIARAFHATRLGYADDTWMRVATRLDAYAASWASATEQACVATRVKGEQSEAMLDLRTSCLDERLDELKALSDVFVRADARTVEKAVQAATSLTSLEPCANLDELSAATRLPPEPAARAKIRALRAEIAAANDLCLTGKQTQSWERLQELRERVDSSSYGPVVVAWTMVTAHVDVGRDLKAAAAEWERAIALTETYHLDRERADAEVHFGRVLNELAQHEEARHWLGLARATLARIGGDPVLELTRDVYESYEYWNEGKYADAARVLEEAMSRPNVARADDPADTADAESFLGLALVFYDTRYDEAVAHARAAVAIDVDAYGPEHPFSGTMLSNLGIVEQEAGRLDDALAAVSRSLAILQAALERGEVTAQNQTLGNAFLNTGIVLVRLGRAGEAASLIEKARAVYRANDEKDGLVNADTTLGEAWRAMGRVDDAERVCKEAREIAERNKDTSPEFLVELLVLQTTLALDRGRSEEALPLAERALAVAQTGSTHLYDVSKAKLALARALDQGKRDGSRARALAEEARDGFGTLHDKLRIADASAAIAEMR